MDTPKFTTAWCGELADHERGPGENEVTLIVEVTAPFRRAGRRVRVTVHRDALADLLNTTTQ